jgi:C4-dicarboxylate transporter DctM subunit
LFEGEGLWPIDPRPVNPQLHPVSLYSHGGLFHGCPFYDPILFVPEEEKMNFLLLSILTILFLTGVPIAIVLSLATFLFVRFTTDLPLIAVPQQMFAGIDTTLLLAIYFFILAGNIMAAGSISKRLVRLISSFMGSAKGGLAITSVVACMFFAAISGSSPATVIAIGGIMIPALVKEGYGKHFSLGLLTSAGSLGILIPPSIPMIIWALVMSLSVTEQFLAGVIPGIVLGCGFIVLSYARSRKEGWGGQSQRSVGEIKSALKEGVWGLSMPIVVLGGIYSGIFTPTEASAVAVVLALFIELFIHRDLSYTEIPGVIVDSALLGSTVLLIISAAVSISWYLNFMMVPNIIAQFLAGMITSKWLFLLLVNVFFLFLGCFVDLISAMLVLGPIFLPTLMKFGIDPIHFGIIMVVNIEIAFLTPPFGINLYVASGITKASLIEVSRSVGPFLIMMYAVLLLLTYVPSFSTFLVNLLR